MVPGPSAKGRVGLSGAKGTWTSQVEGTSWTELIQKAQGRLTTSALSGLAVRSLLSLSPAPPGPSSRPQSTGGTCQSTLYDDHPESNILWLIKGIRYI